MPPETQFVFVHRNEHKPPLTPAYNGPFKVMQQMDKTVTVEKGLERMWFPSTVAKQPLWKRGL